VRELPFGAYALGITREVEIELGAIPDFNAAGDDNRPLKAYISAALVDRAVTTTSVFGFLTLEQDGTPSTIQVNGGFNHGTVQSDQERSYYAQPRTKGHLLGKKKRNSGLGKNQGDASLAAKAMAGAIVLTSEMPDTTGPLKDAAAAGAKVVSLQHQVLPSGLALGKYIGSII
jgi:hypothetical protein